MNGEHPFGIVITAETGVPEAGFKAGTYSGEKEKDKAMNRGLRKMENSHPCVSPAK